MDLDLEVLALEVAVEQWLQLEQLEVWELSLVWPWLLKRTEDQELSDHVESLVVAEKHLEEVEHQSE